MIIEISCCSAGGVGNEIIKYPSLWTGVIWIKFKLTYDMNVEILKL